MRKFVIQLLKECRGPVCCGLSAQSFKGASSFKGANFHEIPDRAFEGMGSKSERLRIVLCERLLNAVEIGWIGI